MKKNIPKKSQNLSKWYQNVILEADLADYGPVKGTMIFKPYGYKIWELMQQHLDPKLKEADVDNAYFPMFIPESLINKEKAHIKGFSPELAVVTIAGNEELSEKLIIRPTSETIIYDSFAKWISSWRDLPVKINQWCNVVRWEKRTYLFLRTSEFLWQEGHSAHATQVEAEQTVKWAADIYQDMYENLLALPGYLGPKSESEKFAGADQTITYEVLMPDGKALQAATSHNLGQNFAKTFDIKFQDRGGKKQYVWQTSWGVSTRSIGGVIMMHGDDNGLRLPPNIAPIQVIILPVKNDKKTLSHCEKINQDLVKLNIRSKVDLVDDESLGYKINKWELKGVPIRLEIGAQEIDSGIVTAARRDKQEKFKINNNKLVGIKEILQSIQDNLLDQAKIFLKKNTYIAKDFSDFKSIMEKHKGFIQANWCEKEECEHKIKQETTATSRLMVKNSLPQNAQCVYCGKKAKSSWYFAQAY